MPDSETPKSKKLIRLESRWNGKQVCAIDDDLLAEIERDIEADTAKQATKDAVKSKDVAGVVKAKG